jgi:dihydrofolate reductase
MRRIRYGVAMSLDGYIAGPGGEYDWIVQDPDIDFAAIAKQFDTYLIGRKTYEATGAGTGSGRGVRSIVISRTLKPADHPKLTIVADAERFVAELRRQPGKDIWLFGGGELFRSLLAAGLVDGVEVAVIPVLLGGGIPLLPPPSPQAVLTLRRHRIYERSGIVSLEYDVGAARGAAKPTAKKTGASKQSASREIQRRGRKATTTRKRR